MECQNDIKIIVYTIFDMQWYAILIATTTTTKNKKEKVDNQRGYAPAIK